MGSIIDVNNAPVEKATSVTDTFIKQRLESFMAAQLSGVNVTFTIFVQNSTGGTITPTLTVKHATALDNWAGTATDVNAVSLQSIANNASAFLCYTFAASSSSYNGLEVTVDFGAALNAGTKSIYWTWADIRYATNFSTGLQTNPIVPEIRPYPAEIILCQRYFRKSFPAGTNPAQSAGVAGAVTIKNPIALGDPSEWVPFNPPMRAKPTITTYNPSAGNANWRDITSGLDVTVSVDPGTTMNDSGVLIATSGTVATLGDILAIHYSATAEL